ncbi:Gfo/Idh/MocA family protein [Alicyclobacillus fodiniaquatilis]|uniref:Gfo/Idh/MocA family protein n=1 Tax=Alicyclobacillus fodiniaquatilis TaxID=1661150 RepID=A0ABW4JGK8_9BACL
MPLQLIQVGLGAHGLGVAQSDVLMAQDFTFCGIVDIDESRLRQASQLLQVEPAQCYTDYKTAFTQGGADAVYITAASPFHYDICKCALEENLHVLVEKPFVTEIDQGKELVAIAKRKGLKLMVDQNYRWVKSVLTLKREIGRQALGEPMFVDAKFFYSHEGKPYQRQMQDYMLFEMGIHHIDMMRFLFDENIHTVRGRTWNTPGSGYLGDPHVYAVYELDGGMPIFYIGSLLTQGLSSPWEGQWRVQCTKGSIHLDDLGAGYGVYLVNEVQEAAKVDDVIPKHESIRGVLAEFADAILHDRAPLSSGEDNLLTLAALNATSDSSRDGKACCPMDYLQ